jgi:predicted N-acetyltransferase YhbS
MKIRRSRTSDSKAINGILLDAFGQEEGLQIVELVNDLLEDDTAKPLLSLVAESSGKLAGHILFTTAHLQPLGQEVSTMILAPLAVSSDYQGKGVGRALITKGLDQLAGSGTDLVFVLGHPGYYPKF